MTESAIEEVTEAPEPPIDPKDIEVDPPLGGAEGVKNAIASKIESILQGGRRYFGSSGAFMTHQAYSDEYEAKGVQKAKAQEALDSKREITDVIKKWIADKPGAVFIESVSVPDWDEDDQVNPETGIIEGGSTDHVILIGSEVIIIDTRNWKKKRNYSVSDTGSALMTAKPFPGGDVAMKDSVHKWLDYLDEDALITGMVVINTEDTAVARDMNWYTQSYRLVEIARFEDLLNDKWKLIDHYDRTHINSTLVAQVLVRAIKPFDPYSKVFDMKSLQSFK